MSELLLYVETSWKGDYLESITEMGEALVGHGWNETVRLIAPTTLCTRDFTSASLQLNLSGVRAVELVLVVVLLCWAASPRGLGVL